MPGIPKRHLPLLVVLAAVQAAFFFYYGYTRHSNYLTSIVDLGQVDQAIWGTAKGHLFLNSVLFETKGNWLGGHFSPILLLFVPLYFVYPTVHWLTAAQSIALPFASVPIYFTAKRILGSDLLAFLWAAAYLCNPFVLNAAAWDFHTVTLAVPLVAVSSYALATKNFRLLFSSLFLVLLCKEHFGLMLVGFGFLWFLRYRELKPAALLSLLGIASFLLVMGIIMPMHTPSGGNLMLSGGHGQLSRYDWLGHSVAEIVINFLREPAGTLRHVLVVMDGGDYLLQLLLPALFAPLLGASFLLPGLADLAVNLLSANPLPRSIFAYHSATLVPLLIVAGAYGLRGSFWTARPAGRMAVTISVLVMSVFMGYSLSSFYPLPGTSYSWSQRSTVPVDDFVRPVVEDLVGDSSLSVQSNLGAHFSRRMELYRFPNRVGEARMVVLRLDDPTGGRVSDSPGRIGTLAHHLQMKHGEYLESVRNLLHDSRYSVIYWNDPWLVFELAGSASPGIEEIEQRLGELAVEWQLAAQD